MRESALDGLLVTTEANVHYFTGFHSPFFQSPTRPWFVVIPARGQPIAVVPSIGESAFANRMHVKQVHSWPAPYEPDDGVSELARVLSGLERVSGKVGAELGHEMTVRMPQQDLNKLTVQLTKNGQSLHDGTQAIKRSRAIKTQQETGKIAAACSAIGDAYADIPHLISVGMTERQACNAVKRHLLLKGVDDTNYVICRSGYGAYSDIIEHPTERVLHAGDMFVVDTGSTVQGYFCDFNRNWAIGLPADDEVSAAYSLLYQATEAALLAARPGVTMGELYDRMIDSMGLDNATHFGSAIGRMGHSVGLQLTEWPSLSEGEPTPLKEDMVITLEPSYPLASGRGFVVSEEVIRITADGNVLLSTRAPLTIPVVPENPEDLPGYHQRDERLKLYTLY